MLATFPDLVPGWEGAWENLSKSPFTGPFHSPQTPTCIQEHLFPQLLCCIHFRICQKLNAEPISPHCCPAPLGPLHKGLPP